VHLKLSQYCKEDVVDISTISGYSQAVVREVLEFWFIRELERYLATKSMHVPFLGEVQIDYRGDTSTEEGREAILELKLLESGFFRRVIGEAEDGDNELIQDLLMQKIKPAISNIINEE